MRELPFDLRFELGSREVHLVHGSPRKVNEYLFEDKPASLYERLASGRGSGRCSCSGTPTSRGSTPTAGVLFVNCGSVGKPKDGDPRAGVRDPRARRGRPDRARRSSASPTTPRRSRSEVAAAGLPGEYAEKLVAAA